MVQRTFLWGSLLNWAKAPTSTASPSRRLFWSPEVCSSALQISCPIQNSLTSTLILNSLTDSVSIFMKGDMGRVDEKKKRTRQCYVRMDELTFISSLDAELLPLELTRFMIPLNGSWQ